MRLRQGIRCIRLTGSIQQKLCAQCLKALDGFLPVLGNAARIFAGRERVERGLVAHQAIERGDFVIVGIKMLQRGRDLQPQLRRVERIAIGDDDVDAAAPLA